MTYREKVIKGLECCSVPSNERDCDLCPIGFGEGCALRLKKNALALLKAQEPRVMTLEEVKSCWRNREIAFLVDYNDGGNPVWMLYYGYLSMQEEIVLIDEIAHLRHFGVDGYGVDWRCWTSRPDEKRRAETPWQQ